MNRRYLLFWVLIFLPFFLKAQKPQFPEDPILFGQQMSQLLKDSGTPQLGLDFETGWNGKFTQQQKNKLINIFQLMNENGFKLNPHMQNTVRIIFKAANHSDVSTQAFDNFISTLQTAVQQLKTGQVMAFLETSDLVLEKRSLFYSSYNSLTVSGGTIDFEYGASSEVATVEAALPEETPDQPEEVEEDTEWFSDWEAEDQEWDADWEEDTDASAAEAKAIILTAEEPQMPLTGPVIRVNSANLIFVTRNDSVSLKGTSGGLMTTNGTFVGKGGRFDWGNVGLNPNEVYCDLSNYNFDVTKPSISASSAQLTYKGKIAEPVKGEFEYKSSSGKTRNISYPRFVSYQENVDIKGISDEKLTYKGGLGLRGKRLYSASMMGGHATIEIAGQKNSKLKVVSRSFQLQDSVILANRAGVMIYHGKDSIYNPAVRFRYEPRIHQVTILKDDGNYKDLPFSSSYFKSDFTADMIKWNIDADSLDISILSAKNKVPSKFESQEYYNNQKFESLVALYGFNPLFMAVGHARKINASEFYATDMAKKLDQNPEKIQGAMRGLMKDGFVDYNSQSDLVKIKRKGYHYVLSRQDRKDYDNILIPSVSPSAPNATLKLGSNEIVIRGIEKFFVSELLDVYIRPRKKEIVMLENRDFRFNGLINAGNFQFIGERFRFNYDSFLIRLPKIDSITFNIDLPGSEAGKDVKLGISNQLRETAGVLYVNKPNNKSARKMYPEYPIFKADVGAVVYFDGAEILDGVYDKSIYFTIPAFELDSASSSDPNVIRFKGVFTSGGIFPDFEEELVIMPDNSLGFEHKLPYVGFKTYNGTGTVYNKISMDKQGLRSNGKVDFLTSTLFSDDFVYYTDSVTTDGESAEIKPQTIEEVSYPKATINDYRMLWFPKSDSMFITSKEEPFQMYDNTATLDGTSLITTSGFFAHGTLFTRGSESVSENFQMTERQIAAKDANFEVKSSDPDKPSLVAQGVSLNFDLNTNLADIKSEQDGRSVLDFPFTQIRTSIGEARWDLEKKIISMNKPEDVDIDQSYFYTTKLEMDSLVFNASGAVYDIDKLEMQVSGVPYMNVADARIIPDSNRVFIRENAEIEKFRQARIILDTINEFHNLYNGNIKVTARHAFDGDAIYQYINANQDTFEISFKNFLLVRDKKLQGNQIFTVATGEIRENDNIYIMPGTLYKGDVTLFANRRILQMDGFIKLDLKSMPDNDSWLAHSSDSEIQDLAINVSEAVSETGQPLTSGINMDPDTGELYGTFIGEKKSTGDHEVFNARGLFSYDSVNTEYKVIDPNKIKGNSYSGNMYSYNDNTTDIRFEGKINLLYPQTQIKTRMSAKGKGNLKDKSVAMNTFQSYEFDIPAKAMEAMALNVGDIIARVGAPPANTDQSSLLYKLADAIGEKEAQEYQRRSTSEFISLASISTDLASALVLSNVNMKWSSAYNSWHSVGNIGVANILDTEINGRLEGFLEIRKLEGNEEFHLFLKASPTTYYYFGYVENRLYTFSSNEQFNTEINKNSKLFKSGIGQYAFAGTDMEFALEFVDRFRKNYLDINEPYEINTFAQEEILDEDFTTFEQETPDDEQDIDDGF
ncbi:MAG: hypothetical protein DHS20C17_19460 [Cyclobacteriaceae bacterium]|nr:MAG: hypothetical protein DHS20C17_19460 [Cyclobacteriaceae bacterium]